MRALRLSRAADADIVDILLWSRERFGEIGQKRYRALVETALLDLAADPLRLGSRERPEFGDGVLSYHVKHARERARTQWGVVRRPRHVVFYRIAGQLLVEVGRVLHDGMDLERHLAEGDFDIDRD